MSELYNLQGSGHGIYESGYADHAQRDSLYDQSNDHPQHGSGKQMQFTIETHIQLLQRYKLIG